MDRTHQEKIARVKQEIAVIIETLRMQDVIFSSITGDQVFGQLLDGHAPWPGQVIMNNDNEWARMAPVRRSRPQGYSNTPAHGRFVAPEYNNNVESKLSATDPSGFRDLLARSCSDLAKTKLQRFKEMDYNATDLEKRVTMVSLGQTLARRSLLDRTSFRSTRTRTAKSRPFSHLPL